jgi:hypothetical protein
VKAANPYHPAAQAPSGAALALQDRFAMTDLADMSKEARDDHDD